MRHYRRAARRQARRRARNPLADMGDMLDIAVTGVLCLAGLQAQGVLVRPLPDGRLATTWPPDMEPDLRAHLERWLHDPGDTAPELDTLTTGLILAGLRAHGVGLTALPGGHLQVAFAGQYPDLDATLAAWLRDPATTRVLYDATLLVQREGARTGGIGRG